MGENKRSLNKVRRQDSNPGHVDYGAKIISVGGGLLYDVYFHTHENSLLTCLN